MAVLLAPLTVLPAMVALMAVPALATLATLATLVAETAETEEVAVFVVPTVAEMTAVVPAAVIAAHRHGLSLRGSLRHPCGGDESGGGERRGGDGTPYELTHAFLLIGRKSDK
ncbi:hypothetical protein GCM10010211_70520 [Streptomyces albospinus]|uniref:Secreted protein n=1 Tax=Streptomyces albospinus TaxID=285515 RepID=A0ABQ2VMK5_9ACTN|nr:hypothetical protein GCM10010211_70520 [Streptomyces albospinus]